MVICKYFLQGTCRFGDNCKFEHQINNDHNYANSTSPLLQNYASKPPQTAPTTTNVDTNTLVKSVINDMTSAEKGGQWLLSSYAPFKERPAFPGFEDHSMEEIRYLFYESVKNGTVEQFKQNLQMMLQQAVMKIKALQNPSSDVVEVLNSIYNISTSNSFSTNQTAFNNNPQTNSIFGGSQPQRTGIFANSSPNQTIFGAANPPPNIFGANQPTQQNNIFRGSGGNSGFGGGQAVTGVFNNQQQQANVNKPIFGNPQPPSAAIYGGGSIFGGGTQPLFTNPPQAVPPIAQPSPFNQQNHQQMAYPAPQQNIFHQNPGNQFGGSQNSNNQFGATQPTAVANKSSFQHTANIFGNLAMQNSSAFGATPAPTKRNEEFYSKLEELNEEEIKWFQSDDLDINKIPEKPPTYEMCFRG